MPRTIAEETNRAPARRPVLRSSSHSAERSTAAARCSSTLCNRRFTLGNGPASFACSLRFANWPSRSPQPDAARPRGRSNPPRGFFVRPDSAAELTTPRPARRPGEDRRPADARRRPIAPRRRRRSARGSPGSSIVLTPRRLRDAKPQPQTIAAALAQPSRLGGASPLRVAGQRRRHRTGRGDHPAEPHNQAKTVPSLTTRTETPRIRSKPAAIPHDSPAIPPR
jgi:hypothetical protein